MNIITPLIDERCVQLGLFVSPPPETNRLHWELTHLWLTEGGSWDEVPEEFRQFQNNHLGGDRHVYVKGFELDGMAAQEADLFVVGWPDGSHKFSPKEEHDWWANVPIDAGFDWGAGTGPYYAQVNAISTSIVQGIGLPYPPYPWHIDKKFKPGDPWPTMHVRDGKAMIGGAGETVCTHPHAGRAIPLGGLHTSFFLVFQEVEAFEPEPPPTPTPEQFQRVLDKAEGAADYLVHMGNEKGKAADIYLGIANVLSTRLPLVR